MKKKKDDSGRVEREESGRREDMARGCERQEEWWVDQQMKRRGEGAERQ